MIRRCPRSQDLVVFGRARSPTFRRRRPSPPRAVATRRATMADLRQHFGELARGCRGCVLRSAALLHWSLFAGAGDVAASRVPGYQPVRHGRWLHLAHHKRVLGDWYDKRIRLGSGVGGCPRSRAPQYQTARTPKTDQPTASRSARPLTRTEGSDFFRTVGEPSVRILTPRTSSLRPSFPTPALPGVAHADPDTCTRVHPQHLRTRTRRHAGRGWSRRFGGTRPPRDLGQHPCGPTPARPRAASGTSATALYVLYDLGRNARSRCPTTSSRRRPAVVAAPAAPSPKAGSPHYNDPMSDFGQRLRPLTR